MLKLKQRQLISYTIAATALLFFSACVDKNYDLCDNNLDKNGVFSPNGFTIPLGNVEEINIFKELKKQFSGDNNATFSYDPNDGTLYVQYEGEFNIDIPNIEVPEVNPIRIHADDILIPADVKDFLIPSPAGEIISLANGIETYEIEKKVSGENWTIEVSSVDFEKCYLDITAKFTGITFAGTSPGKLFISLKLPSDVVLTNAEKVRYFNNTVSKEIDIKDLMANNNEYKFPPIEVASYIYGQDTDLNYETYLILGDDMTVTTQNEFSFDLVLETVKIEPSLFYGKATVEISDPIDDFHTFFDSFKDDDFDFKNPALGIEVRTDIGADFNLNINSLTAIREDGNTKRIGGNSLILKPNAKGDKATWLSPVKENIPANTTWENMAIDSLINYRPRDIIYEFELKTIEGKIAIFFANDMNITGKYTLKLPFDFNKLTIIVSDSIRDVFSQDIYDNFFENSKADDYLEIIADSIDINFPKANVSLSAEVAILREDGSHIDNVTIKVEPETLQAENGDNKLVVKIQGLKNLEEARHLAFNFSAKAGASKLTKDDLIHIRKLRFKSSDGYHFEF